MASIKIRKDKNGKNVYDVQIRKKGYPPQYASFKRKTDADKWSQQIEAAMDEKRHFKTTESKKHTFGELVDRYLKEVLPTKKKSQKVQGSQLLWWKEQLGSYLLSEISPPLIAEQRDKLLHGKTKRGQLRSPSTVVRYLAVLSHLFSIAIKDWGWIEDSPIKNVSKPKEPRGRIRYLLNEERPRLLEACKDSKNPYLYTIVVLALSTGMRQAETLNLQWKDIDLEKGRIILLQTKNGEVRQVAVTGLALELLKKLDKIRRLDTQLLFPGKSGKEAIDLRSAWERALQVANIQDFKYHDLRHSCASYLAMNGASLAEIAEVLGHKTLAMVKRYAHLSDTHTASVVSKMNEKIFG